jgi:hypothetical protein
MHHQLPPRRRRVRVWFLAAAAICVVTLGVIAVIILRTHGFGSVSSPQRTAQQRCESDVRGRLASASTARLSNVQSVASALEPDSRDLFPLTTNKPLKDVDHSRITVWNVSGIVDARTEVGSTIHDPFTCRAYFVDGSLADTLVLFEHDH